MKNLLSCILTVLLAISCQTQPANHAEKSQIHTDSLRRLILTQQAAWNRGDIEGFMQGYHNDTGMQFITRKGVRYGWQATLDSYRKHYPTKDSMGRLEFGLQKVEFLDEGMETGHIAGTWKLYRHADTPSGYFSLITRKVGTAHKIIIDHTW
ncbi:MAG: DUF4440 domain-containing protein [Bacteroidetes bacterium]|nr:DUF4440 domain-containing protein [Bacteroidota bacterium]